MVVSTVGGLSLSTLYFRGGGTILRYGGGGDDGHVGIGRERYGGKRKIWREEKDTTAGSEEKDMAGRER